MSRALKSLNVDVRLDMLYSGMDIFITDIAYSEIPKTHETRKKYIHL